MKQKTNKSQENNKSSYLIVAVNRKAKFDYSVINTLEAGLVLQGSEVKSLRKGHCQLKDSYVVFRKSEAYIQNMYISPYKPASERNHDPERRRKLLLHNYELKNLVGNINQKGLSCIPLKIYFKHGKVKLEVALVKGKRKSDKREALKRKEMDRSARRALKHNR